MRDWRGVAPSDRLFQVNMSKKKKIVAGDFSLRKVKTINENKWTSLKNAP
jgi:hypothetical protein